MASLLHSKALHVVTIIVAGAAIRVFYELCVI